MSDISWRRIVYGASIVAFMGAVLLLIFVLPQVSSNPGMEHGGDWVMVAGQLFLASILFGIGYFNKREGCLTRILLIIVAVAAILAGLLMLFAVSVEQPGITLLWKAVRVCGINDIVLGIIAIIACI